MKIIFASHNKDKEKEVKTILNDVDVVTLSDLNDHDDVEENGTSLEENAFIKAEYYFKKYHMPVISDDTGLFVEALDGAPGIHAARYSGEGATYKSNCEKLLKELEGKENRNAHFICSICYINEEGKVKYFNGKVNGMITTKPMANEGFGYDPIFYVPEKDKTMAEMTKEEKNSLSHRKLALEKFAIYLRELSWEKMVTFHANQILDHEDSEIKKRLLGGMSNYTYVLESLDELYTIRFPGEFAEEFVDREKEARNIKLMESLKVTNKTIYFDIASGIKMARYVEGKPLSEVNDYPFDKVSSLLKVIHSSKNLSLYDYKPFERLEKYEMLLKNSDFAFPREYEILKQDLLSFKVFLEGQNKVLCHGDSQPSNFIINENGELLTVDFEYTGNIDPIYDIACFANLKLEDGLKLLEVYYDKPDKDKYLRFYLWRAFQCFQWFNVAHFKNLNGLSESLNIDFKKVADKYLENIQKLMNKVKEFI